MSAGRQKRKGIPYGQCSSCKRAVRAELLRDKLCRACGLLAIQREVVRRRRDRLSP